MLNNFKARLYQETILATAASNNTLVVLPTGLGKTAIAMMLAEHRLRLYPKSKILMLAPTKPLCQQHLQTFKKHMTNNRHDDKKFVLFTGEIGPEKRQLLWKDAVFTFSTPQCVTGDALIFHEEFGPIKIADLVDSHKLKKMVYGNKVGLAKKVNFKVIGYDSGQNHFLTVSNVWKLPCNQIRLIKTELNNELKCTLEHPLLTIDSDAEILWKKSRDLKKGDYIAAPNKINLPYKPLNLFSLIRDKKVNIAERKYINKLLTKIKNAKKEKIRLLSRFRHNYISARLFFDLCDKYTVVLPKKIKITNTTSKSKPILIKRDPAKELFYLLGAIIGDGHIGNRAPKHGNELIYSEMSYSQIRDTFKRYIKKVFSILPSSYSTKKGLQYYSTVIAEVFNALGIPKGNKTYIVRVPRYMYYQNETSIGYFLAGLFNSDGNATKHMIRFSTASENLASDLKWLLLRLGITSTIHESEANESYIGKRKIKCNKFYNLVISGRKNIESFLWWCPVCKNKYQTLSVALKVTKKKYTRSKDILPIKKALKKAYLEHRANKGKPIKEFRIAYHAGYLSKMKLKELLKKLNSDLAKRLLKIIDTEIRWVCIKDIKNMPYKEHVYDLTVEKAHNFIANYLINHNTVENDLISRKMDLENVSLIIFDEAHRATGNYSYKFVAEQYIKNASYPRILGLTASPGSDKETIDEVCKNLFIEDIEVRTDHDSDVSPYVQETNINWIEVDFPEELKKIKKNIEKVFETRLEQLRELGINKEKLNYFNKKELLQMQAELHGQISSGEKDFDSMKAISLLAEIMKAQHALELLETQGIEPLQKYLDKLWREAKTTNVKATKRLVEDPYFRTAHSITEELFEQGIEHPKLGELIRIIDQEIKNNKTKIIVFTQFRDSATKIKKEIDKKGFRSEIFVGQAKKNGTGLSQKMQKEMLERFSREEFNILISSSVGEEGLDIPKVDTVIFYEPIPSAIRSIQRKGRTGRLEKGRVFVLVTKQTRDVGYRWSAHHKEKRMYRTIKDIKKDINREHKMAYQPQPTLTSFTKSEKPYIKIFADHREKGSPVLKELIEENVRINLQQLRSGDYLLSNRVGVEYKTVKDFVDSLIDGRLLQQIKLLKENFDRPLIIVEGVEDIFSQRNVHPNAIRGLIATILVDYGIPIMQTRNAKETAHLLIAIAKREQVEKKHDFSMHPDKKTMSVNEQQEYIISSLPGVGSMLAKPLLKKFGSVKNVINADEKELREVELIGEKKARKVKEVVDSEYEF